MPLDLRYVEFCVPGTDFYDTQEVSDQPAFPLTEATPPGGWQREKTVPWVYLRPAHHDLPPQGWKIHVSARPGNAEKILEIVGEYCFGRLLTFKFLYGPEQLKKTNAKYADRGSSGKFITVYTKSAEQLHRTLLDLDERLSGEEGPYVLSDLRWRSGPLYVRYGAFTPRFCRDEAGDTVPALEDARGGSCPTSAARCSTFPSGWRFPGSCGNSWRATGAAPSTSPTGRRTPCTSRTAAVSTRHRPWTAVRRWC
ncbi:hypothetical protein SVIO_075560 [Streptomyces violaceusniger]|uniref:RamC N-terminal domain-containing protein n=1 Tax=Streptomyces violaceusniger TaxID=68280 RepID=A0A4D4LFQ1_STRVO|nr:hypothetical protein SVIO_075560 [Streptomyces violaceusniger]